MKFCYIAFSIKAKQRLRRPLKVTVVYEPILFKLCMQVAYWPLLMILFTAFNGNLSFYDPTVFQLYMQVAYQPLLIICYIAFTIKGQTKAAAAYKGNLSVYDPFVFKLCMQGAY